jgi:hypothetical protein
MQKKPALAGCEKTWVNAVVAVTGGIGIVLLVFGLLVFSLFIQLTIASCKSDIELLQTLGTFTWTITKISQQAIPASKSCHYWGGNTHSFGHSMGGKQPAKTATNFSLSWISFQTAMGSFITILSNLVGKQADDQ